MDSLLNAARPPVFCPGCSHERITHTLDKAFRQMGLTGERICMVSDIGCSGLFDTFFHTHALHGLHGRALTYAAGLKLARPELTVVVTMGDGGQGIGGAHLLAACRRNLDLTLLVLNNFNFGMTGGQYSATTPPGAAVGSGFLNQLERPLDVCEVAKAAGAPYGVRCSAYRNDLPDVIQRAIEFKGFSVVDIWGICPGRFSKRNRLTPKAIEESLDRLTPADGPVAANQRREFGEHYRELAAAQRVVPPPLAVTPRFAPVSAARQEVLLLGSAGQRILTAGELLCLAGSARRPESHPEKRLRHHRAAGAFDQRAGPVSGGDRLHRHEPARCGGGAGAGGGRTAPENLRDPHGGEYRDPGRRRGSSGRPGPHPPGGLQGPGLQAAGLGPGIPGGARQAQCRDSAGDAGGCACGATEGGGPLGGA